VVLVFYGFSQYKNRETSKAEPNLYQFLKSSRPCEGRIKAKVEKFAGIEDLVVCYNTKLKSKGRDYSSTFYGSSA